MTEELKQRIKELMKLNILMIMRQELLLQH